jgi:hypothetical protein
MQDSVRLYFRVVYRDKTHTCMFNSTTPCVILVQKFRTVTLGVLILLILVLQDARPRACCHKAKQYCR